MGTLIAAGAILSELGRRGFLIAPALFVGRAIFAGWAIRYCWARRASFAGSFGEFTAGKFLIGAGLPGFCVGASGSRAGCLSGKGLSCSLGAFGACALGVRASRVGAAAVRGVGRLCGTAAVCVFGSEAQWWFSRAGLPFTFWAGVAATAEVRGGAFAEFATGLESLWSGFLCGQLPLCGAWFFAGRSVRGSECDGLVWGWLLLRFGLGGGFGERAFEEEQGLGADRHGSELAGGGHAVDDFADAGARGERREEDFSLFSAGGDGGAEIDGEERGERGGLRGVGAGGELGWVTILEEAPARGLAGSVGGDGAEGGPELDEGAEDGGFSELAAEDFADLDGGLLAFAVEGFPSAEDDGGGASGGRGFPLAVTADGGDPGQDFGSDEEVGLFGDGAEEIEGDGAVGLDEAGGEFGGLGDCIRRRHGADQAHAGFNEGGRGRGELGVAREEEAEADFVEPGGGIVEGQQRGGRGRIGGLMPQRGARDL